MMMRRLILLILIVFFAQISSAQWTFPTGAATWMKKARVDSFLWLNTVDTVHAFALQYPGALMSRTTAGDTSLYMANGNRWVKIGSAAAGGGTIDSAWRINDTLYFRYATGGQLAVKMDYFTQSQSDARYPLLSGSYADPSWITSLDWSKITSVPTNVTNAISEVAISLPSSIFDNGDPVVGPGSGTLFGTLKTQSGSGGARSVWGSPSGGGTGTPSFALLGAADIASGTFGISRGGTGLSSLGTANQMLRVNSGATALEYFSPGTAFIQNQTTQQASSNFNISGTGQAAGGFITPLVHSNNAAGTLSVMGGNSGTSNGGQIALYGGSTANNAGQIRFFSGTGTGGLQGERMRIGALGEIFMYNLAAGSLTDSLLVYNTSTKQLGYTGAKWSVTGNTVATGQFLGSTNNAEVTIKANNDTVIRVLPTGQVAITPKIPTGISTMLLQNKATPNGLQTNTLFSIYKASLGGTTNDHLAGINLFPTNGWTDPATQGPVWFYGYNAAEKAGYLTFGARNQFTDVFPYITVNKNYWLGIGRSGTSTGIDATAIMHIAPGVDSVAPLKLTMGALMTAAQKGAFEYASNTLWFTREGARNKFLFEGYTDTVIVAASGGDYTTLSAAFAGELAGDKLIFLPDSLYTELNPQLSLKQGWKVKGRGMGRTTVRFSFNRAIVALSDGFQLKTDCSIEDLTVLTVNKTAAAGGSQTYYAIHSDISGEFTAKVTRCHLKIVKDDPNAVDLSGYNGLVVGIGTWSGQVLEFADCVIEGQTVAAESRGVINSHNTLATSGHLKPSRLTFRNCLITGGFNALFINDTYTGTENDSARTRDAWEFLGCTIKGGLNFRSQGGKKNGFAFNFSGTSVDEIRNADSIVNTSLSNYNATSLPMPSTVEYWKNVGATDIAAGDLVAYVYANRDPYWNYSTPINTPIGIEKIPSGTVSNFAGIALTNSVAGRFAHIAIGGIAYHNVAYAGIAVGTNVTMSSTGVLSQSNWGGIGRVEKKTSTNMLGIKLYPQGQKGNSTPVVSEYSTRLLIGPGNTDDGATPLQVQGQARVSSNVFSTSGGYWMNAVGSFNLGMRQSGGTDLHLRTAGSDRLSILSSGLVGVSNTAPVSTLSVSGSVGAAITTVTGSTTLDATHYTVRVNNSANVNITLPSAASAFSNGQGRIYNIKKVSNNAFTVTIVGTVDGLTNFTFSTQNQSVTVQSNGTSWDIL